jgi:hypothetical protein
MGIRLPKQKKRLAQALLRPFAFTAASPFGLPPFGLVGWSRFRAVLMLNAL